ncbi:exosortase system-associated protein, TIGR04073 family [Geobacter sp. OR-1]|uniref:exosortase system-associated protein, TIGR04073 family n=1 Tax=Geobacter sp. OR-1 TaxID=1266765 RepID=UPI0005AA40D3|nr:exosortase system-associated protein, TIGR04073 family [Geobacter sp. OR-1]
MRPTKYIFATIALLLAIGLPGIASADRYKTPDTSSPQEIADGMGTKLARGVANFATGWGEIPKQIYYTTKEDGWGKGIVVGPFKGIIMTLVRTVTGVVEVATFPVPYPGFYEPFFDPAYVWQKE